MNMKYNINDKLRAGSLLLYALQWWIVLVPSIITMGLVVGKLHYGADAGAQVFYVQKLFFVLGLTLFIQVLFGHKLPLVVGPASVLLVGILASISATVSEIYTALMVGGAFLVLISILGLLKHLQKVFTPRVVIVILLLIPLTLSPTILKLIFGGGSPVLFNLLFALVLTVALLALNDILKGIWKSTTLIFGIVAATIIYRLCFPMHVFGADSSGVYDLFAGFQFNFGVILSFLICAVALMINEVGSIEAIGQMLSADQMEKRIKRGVGLTGAANILSGALGVIGPIDYSSSPGIIASTRCASRYPFIPAALLLLICAFIPPLVRALLAIPDVVMGMMLLYVMVSQFAAALRMCVERQAVSDFNDGASIGVALLAALIVSFMPAELIVQIPAFVRPIVGNGFIVGIITIIIMEYLIYRKKSSRVL